MPRRLLAATIAGVFALAGASACREQPTVAAYVGDVQLSNAQVERIVDEFKDANFREQHAGDIREAVVSDFVLNEVGRRIATERNVPIQAPNLSQYQDMAQQDKVPLDSEFVRLVADADATMQALASISTPAAPTEADQREVYDSVLADAKAQGQGAGFPSFDQVKAQIDSPDMRSAFAVRPLLRDGVKKYDVVVNPRYQPIGIDLPFSVGGVQTRVVIPLGSSGPQAVTDTSSAPQP